MIAVFAMRVTIAVRCRVCKAEDIVADALVAVGTPTPVPQLPVGWSTVDGYPICPKHEIQVGE